MGYFAGQRLRASELDLPYFHGYKTVAQSIPNNAWTEVTLNAEFLDTLAGHSTVTNAARYTPNRAGYYQVWGQLAYAPNATGARLAQVRKNGAQVDQLARGNVVATGAFETVVPFGGLVLLNGSTDYLSIWAYQGSGAALNTEYSAGNEGSYLIARMVSSI